MTSSLVTAGNPSRRTISLGSIDYPICPWRKSKHWRAAGAISRITPPRISSSRHICGW